MRLRVLGLLLGLALLPVGAQAGAQIVRRRPTENVTLNQALINKLIPLLQAEAASGSGLDSKLAAVAMTKQEYTAFKNTLMAARQDDLNPGALAVKDTTRTANARLYHTNAAVLGPLLTKLSSPPPAVPSGTAR